MMQSLLPDNVVSQTKPGESPFKSINAPTAGAREVRELPVGNHPIQLYSLGERRRNLDLTFQPPQMAKRSLSPLKNLVHRSGFLY